MQVKSVIKNNYLYDFMEQFCEAIVTTLGLHRRDSFNTPQGFKQSLYNSPSLTHTRIYTNAHSLKISDYISRLNSEFQVWHVPLSTSSWAYGLGGSLEEMAGLWLGPGLCGRPSLYLETFIGWQSSLLSDTATIIGCVRELLKRSSFSLMSSQTKWFQMKESSLCV